MPDKATLTDISLRAAKPPMTGATTLWDGALRNFGVRLSSGGTKTFVILLGKGRRQSIGRFGVITLAQARAKAQRIFAERTLGRHAPSTASWEAATATFLAHVARKNRPRTHKDYSRILARYFPFGATKLSEISKQEISKKLDRLDRTPSQQNNAIVCVKIFFRWAVNRGLIEHNPAQGFYPQKYVSRARVLSDEEIKLLWEATKESTTLHTIVRLLLLTGQRRTEIASLQNSWIKEGEICLPSSVCKNSREHTFPIGQMAASILSTRTADLFAGLLFPARGKNTAFNGWSKSKSALDKASGVTDWTLHDLRRTFATGLAALGTPIHVTEKLLNHVSGAHSGIVGIYQRHSYAAEMREAVEKWEAHIKTLLE